MNVCFFCFFGTRNCVRGTVVMVNDTNVPKRHILRGGMRECDAMRWAGIIYSHHVDERTKKIFNDHDGDDDDAEAQ